MPHEGEAKKGRGVEAVEPRLVRALANPVRADILAAASWRAVSPSEYARQSGERPGKASYHFRRLAEWKLLELTETVQAGGVVKHMYRATREAIFSGANWQKMPKSVQANLAQATLRVFAKAGMDSIESGAFGARGDDYLSLDRLTCDEEAFEEIAAILAKTREKLLAVEEEAALRLAKTGEDGIQIAVSLAVLEVV